MSNKATFLVFTEFGELLDLAIHLKFLEGQRVLMHIPNKDYQKIGDGIIEKENNWWECIGKGYLWVFDGCNNGSLQEWLRGQGEHVFGGSVEADELENDRQKGQDLFKKAGFRQPFSKNFKDLGEALSFVEQNKEKRWILKQNADAPKSLNHMGKFTGGEDMILHIQQLQKSWNEAQFGKVDFDLMEVVEGTEMAASAWFNGTDWMRDAQGKVVGFLNFEEKKEIDGNLGETTGEMGTTFIGVDETNPLFKEMMLKDVITEKLREMEYRGVFDINCIKTDEGMVALEPTCRFGIPATSYEFMEGLDMKAAELIEAVAKGLSIPVRIHSGIGMVMVVAAKPYPIEADIENEATSLGERLWFLKDGSPSTLSKDQMQHIHLQNFEKKDDEFRVATKNGYLLTVTGRGKTISQTRERLIKYIEENIYFPGMKFRSDIGERIEEAAGVSTKPEAVAKIDSAYHSKREREIQVAKDEETRKVKRALKKAIYG